MSIVSKPPPAGMLSARMVRRLLLGAVPLALGVTAACSSILGDFSSGHASDGGVDAQAPVDGSSSGDGTFTADGQTHPDGTSPEGSPGTPDAGPDGCAGTVCGSTCTDTTSDPHHCGGCTTDCTTLPHVSDPTGVTCSASACVVPASDCQTGYAHCTTSPLDGCETSIDVPATCGSCTNACSTQSPLCQLDTTTNTYGCVSSCSGGTPTLCDGGTCTNTTSDPNNCMACGNACPAPSGGSATCDAGTCGQACATGDSLCSGACVNEQNDPANCGGCAAPCTAPQTQCVNAACACPSTTPDACGSGSSLTCVNTSSDGANCGTCGHSCLGGTCSNGQCLPVSIYTYSSFHAVGGLTAIASTGAPSSTAELVVGNCASASEASPIFQVPEVAPAGTPDYYTATNAPWCARTALVLGFDAYWSADDGNATDGAIYYDQWYSSLGGENRVDTPGTITSNIVQMVEAYSSNAIATPYIVFTTKAASNNLCAINYINTGNTPSCVTITGGAHGLVADPSNVSLVHVAGSSNPGSLYNVSLGNTGAPGTPSQWIALGATIPYDIHTPAAASDGYFYFSDHTNGAIWRVATSGGTPAVLTSSLPSGRIPVAEAPDGFFVVGSTHVIYFWNQTSGNIWTIASNGTSTAMTLVAANPSGIGGVTTDYDSATAIYWTVTGATPSIMMLAR